MKYKSILNLLFCGIICAFVAASCVKEGPMGPAGADGTDGKDGSNGADGNVTCLSCHSGQSMDAIQAQFSMSVHRSGINAVDYAGARGTCAECHSHEGFVQYAVFGKVLGDITNPTAWQCATCHGIHKTFEGKDYALRLSEPIHPVYAPTTTLDLKGSSNLCATCHQTRAAEPNLAKPGADSISVTAYFGPHHGPQANVVAGVGFAEIPGSVAYPVAGTSKHLNMASCTGCHMGSYSAATKSGGHTWKPSLAACNSCHPATDVNFNYGGVQTDIHNKLVVLRDRLIELKLIKKEGFAPNPGKYPMVQARAYFNWIGLEEDRSLGVHNPQYVNALLTNSIAALN